MASAMVSSATITLFSTACHTPVKATKNCSVSSDSVCGSSGLGQAVTASRGPRALSAISATGTSQHSEMTTAIAKRKRPAGFMPASRG